MAIIKDVAIIGAGLAGTALALALDQQSIPVRIYESRRPNASEIASGVILTPNGLQVLDHLGVLGRIKDRCWLATHRTYMNDRDEVTSKKLVADEGMYGYCNHRIWRRLLLEEMKLMLSERGVRIVYESRFEGVVQDGNDDVVFRINGKDEHASLLVGADGIYSSVRRHICAVKPEYTGTMGILAHINRSQVKWPKENYEKQCTFQGKPGAFFMIPETPDGEQVMVGKQVRTADQSREEWEALQRDKDRICEYFREGYDEWHETARQIIDAVCTNKDEIYLWPYLRMPKLDSWCSPTGRVIMVGDGAHALPPSSGQGVNQALEDVYSLSMVLTSETDLSKSLKAWQEMRQLRVDAVFDWATNSQNVMRLPAAERERLIAEGKISREVVTAGGDDMSWLYKPRLKDDVARLISLQA